MGGDGGMGRQAWGRISESLHSRLLRGEMQTQEQGVQAPEEGEGGSERLSQAISDQLLPK